MFCPHIAIGNYYPRQLDFWHPIEQKMELNDVIGNGKSMIIYIQKKAENPDEIVAA